MSDFQLIEIEIIDNNPELKVSHLKNDEDVIQHFLKKMFQNTHQDDWNELVSVINTWISQSKTYTLMFPKNGKWVINLGGDKVLQHFIDKPPLGITPKFLHNEIRVKNILDAIERYNVSGIEIPIEWIDELKELKS